MKPRRWVLILLAALLAGGVLLNLGLRMLERSRGVERLLIQHIAPLIGGDLSVGRIRLGIFAARLEDVHLVLPMRGLRIEVRDIKAGFSLWRLLRARGNVGQAISRIVLLEPVVTLTLLADVDSAALAPIDFSIFQRLPAGYLSLERGAVRIIDRGGHSFVFGENLSGRIGDEPGGVVFELRGSVASSKKNLALSGVLARNGKRHRVSLRLNRAKMDRPLSLGSVTISQGVLDGVCEFAFGDTVSAATVDAQGIIRIAHGQCGIRGLGGNIDSIQLVFRLEGSYWHIDTLRGRWNGVFAMAKGVFNAADADTGRLEVRCDNIDLHSFTSSMPASIAGLVLGSGWCAISLAKAPGANAAQILLTGGGVSLAGIPVTKLSASITADREGLALDSLRLEGAGARLRASGELNFRKEPWAYSLNFEGDMDTCPVLPRLLQGDAAIQGSLRGLGSAPTATITMRLFGAALGSAPLGNPQVQMRIEGQRAEVAWESKNPDYVFGTLSIDSIISPNPPVTAKIHAGKKTLLAFLDWMHDSLRASIREMQGNIVYRGKGDAYQCTVQVATKGGIINGGVRAVVSGSGRGEAAGLWRLVSQDLTLHDSLAALTASGRWWPDSLSIDSLCGFGGVVGRCKAHWERRPYLDAFFDMRDIRMQSLNAWLWKGALPVEQGMLSGRIRLHGFLDSLASTAELHLRDASVSGIGPLSTDAVMRYSNGVLMLRPLVVRHETRAILSLDTLAIHGARITVAGAFEQVELGNLLRKILPEEATVSGKVSGRFSSSPSGYPVVLHARSRRIKVNEWNVDSVLLVVEAGREGLEVRDFRCADSTRTRLWAQGVFPYAFFNDEMRDTDTVRVSVRAFGDLLATVERNIDSPVGGQGTGEMHFEFIGAADGWQCRKGSVDIPRGTLLVRIFVPSPIENFSLRVRVRDSSLVDTEMHGVINRKRISLFSTHSLPPGYEGLKVGPVDLGALQVWTPDRGVDLHLPGFMEIGETGRIEFAAKKPFDAFTLSGPFDRLRITGMWVLHDVAFTFPFLHEPLPWNFDPFPYVTWELDLTPGRKTVYFWDLRGKRRQLVRFFEGNLDKSSIVMVRGRDREKTFQLQGSIRCYKGAVYYGKVFDRNVKVGLDFAPQRLRPNEGYDNLPIIWGSAEAFSDSSRFDRVTLTLRLLDPVTGGVSERGRIAMIPRGRSHGKGPGAGSTDSIPNFIFHLSSKFEEIPGESELEFYREAGLQFSTFEGATEFVSSFGEQYLHRYFLQRIERRLAKMLGLDVITFETSIASNYFSSLYHRRYSDFYNQWNLLANMGLTVGRYILNDYVFLKARGELVPSDTAVRPEYSVGMEFAPSPFFVMDVDYGFYLEDQALQQNPRVQMQLRLPITRLRNILKF